MIHVQSDHTEILERILSIHPSIRFVGIIDKDGYIISSMIRRGLRYLTREHEMLYMQAAIFRRILNMFNEELGYVRSLSIVREKVKMFTFPLGEYSLLISTEPDVNSEEISNRIIRLPEYARLLNLLYHIKD